MTIHHEDDNVTLHHGDALDVLRTLPLKRKAETSTGHE